VARRVPRVLSIAGTDPTGGAGIQADLKSIAALGGYGMAVVTALVAQNTCGVRSVHTPPTSFLREQLDAVSDDVEIDAVKIGMLGDAEVVRVVRDWLVQARPPVVVLDPVMVATSGDRLLDAEAEEAVRDLVGYADLVTPNLEELAVLARTRRAADWPEALAQAAGLAAARGTVVLAKGGHLAGPDCPDALVGPGDRVVEVPGRRVTSSNTHGTGCSLSSGMATALGRGTEWSAALVEVKTWLADALAYAAELEVGRGKGPVNHLHRLWAEADL
jgi:hydroxymethylpyrimidine kinase/phosphomethylpyrimidine kinase